MAEAERKNGKEGESNSRGGVVSTTPTTNPAFPPSVGQVATTNPGSTIQTPVLGLGFHMQCDHSGFIIQINELTSKLAFATQALEKLREQYQNDLERKEEAHAAAVAKLRGK